MGIVLSLMEVSVHLFGPLSGALHIDPVDLKPSAVAFQFLSESPHSEKSFGSLFVDVAPQKCHDQFRVELGVELEGNLLPFHCIH